MPLITTPGAANADSYASVVEADACNAQNLYASGWATAASADKESALRMATRLLDSMPAAWTGAAANAAVQALGWPRTGMKNRNNYPIPSSGASSIPGNLKCAQAEYARLLLENDLTGAGASGSSVAASGIKSVSAAGVSVSFGSSSSSSSDGPPGPDESKTYGKEAEIMANVPISVIQLLVPSWLRDPRDIDAPYSGLVVESL